jgi:hypothetical protein
MTTLVLPSTVAAELLIAADEAQESAAVLLARLVVAPDGNTRILARSLHWVPDDMYVRRTAQDLLIASGGYIHALGIAEQRREVAFFLHTHTGKEGKAEPSKRDALVDEQLIDLFRDRTGSSYYGSLVVAKSGEDLLISGSINDDRNRMHINRVFVVGDRLSLSPAYGHQHDALPAHFDRNVRAFGGDIQRTVRALRVGIVGCGGTGSAVAEQLVRLGVRDLILLDPDKLSASNVTRVYGSTPADIEKLKIDVLGTHLMCIAPDAHVTGIAGMLTKESDARELTSCDVIFGCTDDNAGRLVLSRMATYLMVPVIDCGVLLSGDDDGHLAGIDGRITTLVPGVACLMCRGRIDIARARAELMIPEERGRLAGEGYAPALGDAEPAVVAFTTSVAATAVGELLERLIHYGIEPVPSEIILRIHEREMSTNTQKPTVNHFCDPSSDKIGSGMTEPFLDFQWPS